MEEQLKEAPVIAFPGKAVSEADESRSVSDRNSVQSNKKLSMDTDDLQEISAQIAKEDTASYDAQQILEQMKQDAVQPQRQRRHSRRIGFRVPGRVSSRRLTQNLPSLIIFCLKSMTGRSVSWFRRQNVWRNRLPDSSALRILWLSGKK